MHLIRDRNLVFSEKGEHVFYGDFSDTQYNVYNYTKNQWSYNSVFARLLSIIFYFGCNLL